MDHPFRNSVFGGFNRQDVLTYLENASKETVQTQQALQQKLDEAQGILAQQDAEQAAQQEQLNRLVRENEELRTQLEQANTALSSSRTEYSQMAEALDRSTQEAEEWKARSAALAPDAAAYAAIKERTAGVELDAHRRAQAVQEQAAGQAKQLRRQMEQWLQKVVCEYDALRSEVDATVSHAADKLSQAGKCLTQASALLGEQNLALEALTQAYGETDPARASAPVPLSEE